MLFKKSRFLDADLEDWLLETMAWLMRNLGGTARLRRTPSITPSANYFPPTNSEGAARGAYIFDRVKLLMGLTDWPCELEAYERLEANAKVGELLLLRNAQLPNGLFRVEKGRATIAYAADLVARPKALIATLAHELSHYLLACIEEPPPGDHEIAHELAADLCVVYCGFGVFGANAAFEFEQHSDAFGQGWSSRHSGYFSERTWAFALAVMATLKEEGIPDSFLKPSVAQLSNDAMRYLSRRPELLTPLREIA